MNAWIRPQESLSPCKAEDLPIDVGIRAVGDGEGAMRSFLASTPAMPDESLIGWLARVGALNAHRSLSKSLRKVGVRTPCPESILRSRAVDADRVAFLLKADTAEVIARTHPFVGAAATVPMVDFFGIPVRSNYVSGGTRRVSPRALKASGHHRAVWTLQPLSFDPETMETLIHACPVCGGSLGWQRAAGVCFCDRCTGRDRSPKVDLRDFPQPLVEVEDVEALRFVASLVDPVRPAPLPSGFDLPECIRDLPRGDLFDLATLLAGVLQNDAAGSRDGYARRFNKNRDFIGLDPGFLATAGRAIINWPDGYFRIADMMRSTADRRSMIYGVQKELGPLYFTIKDFEGSEAMTTLFMATVEADLDRTDAHIPLLRSGKQRQSSRVTATEAAHLAGVKRGILSSLACTGMAKAEIETGIIVFERAEIEAIVAERANLIDVFETTARLGVPRSALPDLVAGGLVERVTEGPALHLVEGREHYRRPSLERLLAEMENAIRGDREKSDMRLTLAASKSFVGHKPWRAIIDAIRSGDLDVRRDVNRKAGILNAMAVDPEELEAVIARARPPVPADPDETTNYIEASAYFGVREAAFPELTAIGLLPAYDRVKLRLRRGDLDLFAKKYLFTDEIARRLGTTPLRARNALDAAGVRPAATVIYGKVHVWDAALVEEFISKRLASRR